MNIMENDTHNVDTGTLNQYEPMETIEAMQAMGAMEAYIKQASDINSQLILLISISLILGLGKGGVPGFATVATALTVATAPLNVDGGLAYAVSLQVPILAMIDISAAYIHSRCIDWYTTWLLLPLSFVGMGIGQVLDRYMTDALARIIVGFILLALLTFKLKDDILRTIQKTTIRSNGSNDYHHDIESSISTTSTTSTTNTTSANHSKSKSSPPTSTQKHYLTSKPTTSKTKTYTWAFFVGIFGGAATMLTNSMGPILNVYLLSVAKLSPSEYIGTRAMFFCFLNIGKIPMRFASGALGWSMIPLAFGLGLVAVLGVFCAKPIMLSMKESTFVKLELVVVAFAGMRLMWLGLTM
jgi:uncharacterized membrane protein YfcA